MKTPEHIYQPACARCRDEAGKDRAGVVDTSLCNWHTNDLVLSLRAEVERLKEALDRYGQHDDECDYRQPGNSALPAWPERRRFCECRPCS